MRGQMGVLSKQVETATAASQPSSIRADNEIDKAVATICARQRKSYPRYVSITAPCSRAPNRRRITYVVCSGPSTSMNILHGRLPARPYFAAMAASSINAATFSG